MRGTKQETRQITSLDATKRATLFAMYDRYGSMAYGIILRIIPEPERAQAVLIDLFSSPPLTPLADLTTPTGSEIVRLARMKALMARSESSAQPPSSVTNTNDTAEKVVFDLSFSQGYSLEAISDKLHMPRTNVLKSIYTYFQYLRSS
jgi:hypothetical protein